MSDQPQTRPDIACRTSSVEHRTLLWGLCLGWIFFIYLFFTLDFLTGFLTDLTPFEWAWGKGSHNLVDGTLARLLDKHLVSERSFIFTKTRPYLAVWIYRLTGQTQSKCVVGHDGWLFHEWSLRQSWNEGVRSSETGLSRLATLRTWLKQSNIEMLVMIPPSKVRIYPEYFLGGKIPPYLENKYSHYLNRLHELGFQTIDLERVFLKEKKIPGAQDPLYLSGYHHWTDRGGLLAMRQVAEVIQKEHADWCNKFPGNVEALPPIVEIGGSGLYGQLGFPKNVLKEYFCKKTQIYTFQYHRPFSDEERKQSPILLVGDSFFAEMRKGRSFLEYLLQTPVCDFSQQGGEYQGALINLVRSGAMKEKRQRLMIYECWEPQIVDRQMASLIDMWTKQPEELKKPIW